MSEEAYKNPEIINEIEKTKIEKISPKKQDSFIAKLLKACKQAGKISIIITAVDPDSIGAAMLFRLLVIRACQKELDNITIYYGGKVSHPQNETIFNLFSLSKIFRPAPNNLEKQKGELWVLLDSNCLEDKRVPFSLLAVDIIIDHHCEDTASPNETLKLIDSVGACSTLVAEILVQNVDLSETHVEQKDTLTLASIGIRNDTEHFMPHLTDDRDQQIYFKLCNLVDNKLIAQCENYPLGKRYREILKEILSTCNVLGSRAIASAGYIASKDGDLLSEAAALLLRDSQVSLAVVWGIIEEEARVRLSIRSYNPSLDLDKTIRDTFGYDRGSAKQSRGYGKGGAVMLLGDLGPVLEDESYRKDLLKVVERQITARVDSMIKSG